MLRLVSSMNSTLTCVTPPRDPVNMLLAMALPHRTQSQWEIRTCATEHSCHFDKLDGNLSSIHIGRLIDVEDSTIQVTVDGVEVRGWLSPFVNFDLAD